MGGGSFISGCFAAPMPRWSWRADSMVLFALSVSLKKHSMPNPDFKRDCAQHLGWR
jgi:hypothetical protein